MTCSSLYLASADLSDQQRCFRSVAELFGVLRTNFWNRVPPAWGKSGFNSQQCHIFFENCNPPSQSCGSVFLLCDCGFVFCWIAQSRHTIRYKFFAGIFTITLECVFTGNGIYFQKTMDQTESGRGWNSCHASMHL